MNNMIESDYSQGLERDSLDLQQKLKELPECPGVYLMRDSCGIVIYVGKSKNLKKRVTSYFKGTDRYTSKLENLMRNLNDFEYLTTDTEFEALMLECDLIGRYKPAYNRQMKNPKSYRYIRIDPSAELPEIEVVLEKDADDGCVYYGPYNSKSTLQKAIDAALHSQRIRCNRLKRRQAPCLNDELGLCNGICRGKTTVLDYKQAIGHIIELIEGTGTTLLDKLTSQMNAAAAASEFETAAILRDQISSLQYVTKQAKILEHTRANRNLMLLEPVESAGIKLIVLSNYDIVYRSHYPVTDCSQLEIDCVHWAICLSQKAKELPVSHDEKLSADKAHIIYSHLNKTSAGIYCKTIGETLNENDFRHWLHDAIRTLCQSGNKGE